MSDRRSRDQLVVGASMLIAGCTLASVALAGNGPRDRQNASYEFTQQQTDRSTGERFRIDYKDPSDPQGQPKPVRRVVTVGPRGTRYDVTAPRSCTASDAELMARGGAACPKGSSIGGGVVVVDTGVPGPGRYATADAELFNNARDPNGEFIYVNTVRGSEARTVIRANVKGRRTITKVGTLPGAPPDGGSIDTAKLRVTRVDRRVGGQRRHYVTTPRGCPQRGTWTTLLRFGYGEGQRQTERTRTRCEA